MIGYLVSLLMGLAVGAAYGLVQVRSPAPPLIALIGLLGMVLGQQAVDVEKRCHRSRSTSPPAAYAGIVSPVGFGPNALVRAPKLGTDLGQNPQLLCNAGEASRLSCER